MIKYNDKTINDWNYGSGNIIKVYYRSSVVYHKIGDGGSTPPAPTAQTPCFAVVDDISQYQGTTYDKVYNKADSSWYMLNSLSQYEKYGVYGEGRDITTYEGKLTVDDGYEYEWDGSQWVSLGEAVDTFNVTDMSTYKGSITREYPSFSRIRVNGSTGIEDSYLSIYFSSTPGNTSYNTNNRLLGISWSFPDAYFGNHDGQYMYYTAATLVEDQTVEYDFGETMYFGGSDYQINNYNTSNDAFIPGRFSIVEEVFSVPKEYAGMAEPEDNVQFATMAAALQYECPWVGMKATIGGELYAYTENGWEELTEHYSVSLNSQWQESASYGDLSADASDYEFFESFSNKGVPQGLATMFITINGYKSFSFKVRNYSDNNYDYVVVNNIDDTSTPTWQPSVGEGLASSGKVYYSNKGKSSNSIWYDVEFSDLDGGEHIIAVTFGKDRVVDIHDDKGYVAIPVNQQSI